MYFCHQHGHLSYDLDKCPGDYAGAIRVEIEIVHRRSLDAFHILIYGFAARGRPLNTARTEKDLIEPHITSVPDDFILVSSQDYMAWGPDYLTLVRPIVRLSTRAISSGRGYSSRAVLISAVELCCVIDRRFDRLIPSVRFYTYRTHAERRNVEMSGKQEAPVALDC